MDVTIKSSDLNRLARDLKAASNGKELRKEFVKEVGSVIRPVAGEVRAGYRGMVRPASHAAWGPKRKQQPPLGTMLAKATGTSTRLTGRHAGVRLAVRGKGMPSGYRSLPRYVEGEQTTAGRGRWRHPAWGRRHEAWVQQPAHPTATPIVQRHQPAVAQAVERAAEQVRAKLERGSS